jgi:hypothetical protein
MSEAANPTRKTETRHSLNGKTCHHFQYHGLTCDEYDALRARAAGHCELCGTAEPDTGGRRLVVDHYEGNQLRFIRGLLCDRCNSLMSCIDGRKRWGPDRSRVAAAREYERRSWHQPSRAQWEQVEREQTKRAAQLR